MPNMPVSLPVSYWTHCFDLGRWCLIEAYADGQGLFEPIDDDWDRQHPMTLESRRRRYHITGMDPHHAD